MRIWSRASAWAAKATSAVAAAVMSRRCMVPPIEGDVRGWWIDPARARLLCAFDDSSMTSRAASSAVGSRTAKVLPAPGVLSIARCPWWRRRMCLTMASPRPVPRRRRLRPAVDPVEALGEPRQMLRRDARALVGRRRSGRRVGRRRHRCPAVRPSAARPSTRTVVPLAAILDRIVDQVDEQLMQLVASPTTARQAGRQVDHQARPCSARRPGASGRSRSVTASRRVATLARGG